MNDQELEGKVRQNLTEIAAEEYYQLLQDPAYMGKIIPMAKEIAIAGAKMYIDGDDENDADDDEYDFEVLADAIYDQIDEMFTNDEQLREIAYQIAMGKYVTKAEAKAYLDGYIDGNGLGRSLDHQEMQELRAAHGVFLDKCQVAYDFVEKLISDMAKTLKKDGAINIKTRNAQIRKIVPSAEEYISIYSTSKEAGQEYFEEIQKIIIADEETRVIGKAIYEGISKSMDSVTESILQHEAKTIYND